MANILIIDDDDIFAEMLYDLVTQLGHQASIALTLREGLDKALLQPYDVIFLDIRLPDGNGLDIMQKLRETPSDPEIIIVTGFGELNGAELAIKSGAWDYIEKPSSYKAIQLIFQRVLQYRTQKLPGESMTTLKFDGVMGSSPEMKACLNMVSKASRSDVNVLIRGGTGTGKELFAMAIHMNSTRAKKNFVVVDCSALPENLVESILFGHEKGAFTSADKAREGLVKQADGGTLFLDEVGELPPVVQKNFLRVLQERRFRPVGGSQEIESNFRLISATNKDLDRMVEEGRFREDLLFRLKALVIDLPPLQGRVNDIKELARHYTTKLCNRYNISLKSFSPDFLETLAAYNWPGNVRELIGALERAISTAFHEPVLFPNHLPDEIRIRLKKAEISRGITGADNKETQVSNEMPTLKDFRERAIAEAERRYLDELMTKTNRDIQEACRVSGLSRPRLYALLKEHGLIKTNQ